MNILVAQSGGPTPVINSSLYGVVSQSIKLKTFQNVYASTNGMEGIMNDKIIRLNDKVNILEKAKYQPGAILGGSRYQLKDKDFERIVDKLEELSIKVFCYIGGNGSATSIYHIHKVCLDRKNDIRCMFIPKTVDNDITGTDHTPGFISAANFLLHSIRNIEADFRSFSFSKNIEIVEVMGGGTGWLIASGTIGKRDKLDFPQLAYIPEFEWETEDILHDIENSLKNSSTILILIPDHMSLRGIHSEINKNNPRNNYNGGISYRLAQEIQKHIDVKTRITIPHSLYRSSRAYISNLDLEEAEMTGREAVNHALSGASGKMIGIERTSNFPYAARYKQIDLSEISGRTNKLPLEFWDKERHKPTEQFENYLSPLLEMKALPKIMTIEDLS